jgi:formylglycine-generating enzyme required for sulfatase activity
VGLRADGLPDIDWVAIPAGPFLMGSSDEDEGALEDEKPQREIRLAAFRIARVPVTNAQYQAFIDDGGYADRWKPAWSDEGWSWKEDRTGPCDYDAVFLTPNHPRAGVTWYEAQAFCKWLSVKLESRVELPSEEQWEKAARGADGRIYPWGNGYDPARVNGYEAGIESTTAVGLFLSGASPYGVLDMSGNVWEWCADESKVARSLRGGSFDRDLRLQRSALRDRGPADHEDMNIGFRVSSPL